MQCTNRYLPLCSIPERMSRDGNAGLNAKVYLPFAGFYFFSGETITFYDSTIAQDKSRFFAGVKMPNTFKKYGAWVGGQV